MPGRSFGAVAAAYARHRPGYPAAALEWALAPAPGGEVLDLGAGTGKVTGAAAAARRARRGGSRPRDARPVPRRFPTVDAHEGTAERIPLPDARWTPSSSARRGTGSNRALAEPEIARVLRPGGVLVVLWNGDDDAVEWVRGYHRALHPEDAGADRHHDLRRPAEHPAFGAPRRAGSPTRCPPRSTALVETIATHSWALIAEPPERDASLARMRDYLAARPETSPGAFTLPMVTDVVRTLRR